VLTTYGMGSISGGIALCMGTSAPIAQEAANASKRNVKKRPMVNKQSQKSKTVAACCVSLFPNRPVSKSYSYIQTVLTGYGLYTTAAPRDKKYPALSSFSKYFLIAGTPCVRCDRASSRRECGILATVFPASRNHFSRLANCKITVPVRVFSA
jgi:hypothetical protein